RARSRSLQPRVRRRNFGYPRGRRRQPAERHTDRSSGAVAAAYRASWRDLPADWVLTMEGQELIGSTAREVLARAALSDHELAGVVALTSFEVDAAMAGAERGYRAAFLWLSAPDGQMRFRAHGPAHTPSRRSLSALASRSAFC
ncbi:MAG TPA: hypothetical protein VF100_06115, partial [Thermoanaerobaculia bacterium]